MLYLIIASVIWAFSFGLIKGLGDLDYSFVSWIRLVIALPIFLPFFRMRELTFRLGLHLFLLGALQYGFLYIFYTASFQYLDSYQVALFTIFVPIYVTLFDNIYTRRVDWLNLVMAILAVMGAAIIEYEHKVAFHHLLWGFILVQFSNISFAFGQIEYRRLRRIYPQIKDREVYALMFLGAVVLTTVVTVWQGGVVSFGVVTAGQLWTLLFLGVVATGFACFLWNVGSIKTQAGVLAVMNNIKIPLAVFVSLTVFQEKTNIWRLLLGGGIMIMAVVISEYFRNRKQLAMEVKKSD